MIFLDTNLLWWIAHPGGGAEGRALRQKIATRMKNGDRFAVAEICDYEARRELLRKKAIKQLERLDAFLHSVSYIPITSATMKSAALLWADLRSRGQQFASDESLDGDVILAAEALNDPAHLVATHNQKHLGLLCKVIDWQNL